MHSFENRAVGFAFTGSFCTMRSALDAMRTLAEMNVQLTPIFSPAAASIDTRFGKAADFCAEAEAIAGRPGIYTIGQAEPIGPRRLLDALIVAPCTGNTLAKLAQGITDTSVTMACKAHLRNGRPLLLAIASNDALSAGAKNIGMLLSRRHIYFTPFGQDDPIKKPTSLIADFALIPDALAEALAGRQMQPLFCMHS